MCHRCMYSAVSSFMNSVFFCIAKVGSNAGIIGMTKEHLGLALALNVPVFVVVTKIDMCPANILQGNVTHFTTEVLSTAFVA